MAYADTLFRLRRFQQAIAALEVAQKLSPTDPALYALRAQIHAKQGAREDALRDIQLAEQYGKDQIDILMATGGALLALGDRDAAMQRFSRALDIPNGDRIGVRLAIAQVFLRVCDRLGTAQRFRNFADPSTLAIAQGDELGARLSDLGRS